MEPKRVELMTVGPVDEQKKTKKRIPTLRFNLTLTESTDKICPEFSYSELMKNALGAEENEDLDPLDPFASKDKADDDKLMAIAKAFEEKYGNGIKPTGKKRKLKDHLDDLVDLGEGYDLEDPFIDNTEAYDEVVPCNMTTKLGGFYINSGTLDFKLCSDDDDDDDFQPSKTKRKKRQITSDSESETGEKKKKKKKLFDGEKKKRKKLLNSNGQNAEKGVKKKKKLVSSEKIKMNKLKKTNPVLYWKLQVENMQRQKQQPSEQTSAIVNGHREDMPAEAKAAITPAGTEQNDIIILDNESPVKVGDAQTPEQTTTPITGGNAQNSMTTAENNNGSTKVNASQIDSQINNTDSSPAQQQQIQKPKLETIPSLPDTLSLKTLSTVEKLKAAAKDAEAGKTKFFSPEVNEMLLHVEKDAKQLSQNERSVIYSHLAAYLPVTKDTLVKRAKKLVMGQQDDRLKEPINNLKEAISVAMPPLLEKHQAECAAAEQLKQERSQTEKQKEGGGGSTESDEDSKEGPEKQKRILAPRKKFEWNPFLRQLLCTVVVIKMDHYETSKVRSQSPEEYLKAFLDAEIRPLWPPGWIQTRMLFKESRSVHGRWTSQPQKPKKPIVPIKNTPSSSPALSNNVSKSNQPTPANNSVNSTVTPKINSTPISSIKTGEKSKLLSISPSIFCSPDLPQATTKLSMIGNKEKEIDMTKTISVKKEEAIPSSSTKDKVMTILDYAETNNSNKSRPQSNTDVKTLTSAKQSTQQLNINSVPAVGDGKSKSSTISGNNSDKTTGCSVTQKTKELLKHLVAGANISISRSSNVNSSNVISQSKPRSRPNTPATSYTKSVSSNTLGSSKPVSVAGEQDYLQKFKEFTGINMSHKSESFLQAVEQMAKSTGEGLPLTKQNSIGIPTLQSYGTITDVSGVTAKNDNQTSQINLLSKGSKLLLNTNKISSNQISSSTATKPVNISLNSAQVSAAKLSASSVTHKSTLSQNIAKSVDKDTPHSDKSMATKLSASSGSSISGNPLFPPKYVKLITTKAVSGVSNVVSGTKMLGTSNVSELQKGHQQESKLSLNKASVCVVTTNSDGTKQIHIAKPTVVKTHSPNQISTQKLVKMQKAIGQTVSLPHKSHHDQSKEKKQSNSNITSTSGGSNIGSNAQKQTFGGISLQQLHMQMVQKNSQSPTLNKNSNKSSGHTDNTTSAWSPTRLYNSNAGNIFSPPTSMTSHSSPGYHHSGLGQQSGNLSPMNHPSINTSPDRYSQGSTYTQQSGGHRSPHGSPVPSRSPQGFYPGMVGSPSPTRHPNLGRQYHRFRYPNTDHSQQQYRY